MAFLKAPFGGVRGSFPHAARTSGKAMTANDGSLFIFVLRAK
jgi:hypothetical protein